MMAEHDENVIATLEQQASGNKKLKRRGLIAGAAALVTGMLARQTVEPVAAGGTDHTALIIGETNNATLVTYLTNANERAMNFTGKDNTVGVGGFCNGASGLAVFGYTNRGTGVYGHAYDTSLNGGVGVSGESNCIQGTGVSALATGQYSYGLIATGQYAGINAFGVTQT
ncbi:MAG: hypothetical protein LC748_17175, partial [Thermomicrobia bacterium]|nr:hypothetical protein [Thermomicrobia bacterium]